MDLSLGLMKGLNRGRGRRLALHSFRDLERCRRCSDKGIYCGGHLVGAVTKQGNGWYLWKIEDSCGAAERADLAMYEENAIFLGCFETLRGAKRRIREAFEPGERRK